MVRFTTRDALDNILNEYSTRLTNYFHYMIHPPLYNILNEFSTRLQQFEVFITIIPISRYNKKVEIFTDYSSSTVQRAINALIPSEHANSYFVTIIPETSPPL